MHTWVSFAATMGRPKAKRAAAVVSRKRKSKVVDGGVKNNPFEVRVNRKKHDVLGQKLKSGRGLPGVSRSRAIQKVREKKRERGRERERALSWLNERARQKGEHGSILRFQRKKTLLQEYRLRHKTGKLLDRRFGEYDEDLSIEERGMKRFLLEKQVCKHTAVL